jgi:hypothetical protein
MTDEESHPNFMLDDMVAKFNEDHPLFSAYLWDNGQITIDHRGGPECNEVVLTSGAELFAFMEGLRMAFESITRNAGGA